MRSALVFVTALLVVIFAVSFVDAKPDGSLGKDCAKCHKDGPGKPPAKKSVEKAAPEVKSGGAETQASGLETYGTRQS